jgi:acetyl esterase/lipase
MGKLWTRAPAFEKAFLSEATLLIFNSMSHFPKPPPIGEARNREILSSATTYFYRETPSGKLLAHFFFPPDFDYQRDRRPAIFFFHGGLWDITAPSQFVPHCHHFALRGMVAATLEYRTAALFEGTPEDAIADAKDALAFFQENADAMGIDASRIVVVGACAGANAALAATLHPHGELSAPLVRPAALILFGPVSDTSRKGVGNERFATQRDGKIYSPIRYLPRKKLPPCLIFHAKKDRVVPIEQSQRFVKKYRKRRNRCELIEFEKAGHTFFNYNSDQANYEITLRSADHFLVDLGLLDPDPLGDDLR